MMLTSRSRIFGLALAALVFGLDQIIKGWVRGAWDLANNPPMELLPVFRLVWSINKGVSLGFLTAGSDTERWILVALTSAIAAIVLVWLCREKRLIETVPLGLVLGGALGNILDRARLGYVVDYADLHFGEWRPFLIFNLADAAITLGVLIILARSLLMREKRSTQTPDPIPATEI